MFSFYKSPTSNHERTQRPLLVLPTKPTKHVQATPSSSTAIRSSSLRWWSSTDTSTEAVVEVSRSSEIHSSRSRQMLSHRVVGLLRWLLSRRLLRLKEEDGVQPLKMCTSSVFVKHKTLVLILARDFVCLDVPDVFLGRVVD